jgi:TolB-like protein
VRRLLAAFLLCSSLALVAATPAPRATLPPKAAPTFSPAPSGTGAGPTVLVYPFTTPSDLDARYGTAVAQIYDEVFAQSGGLTVLNSPEGVKREDYAKVAKVQHADYYISGYIEPIGTGAAIVMQIVDVSSDIAVYAQTTQVQGVPDVGSQALYARNVILQASGIESTQITTTKETPTPSSTSGASVSLTNVLGDIFKGKGKGKGTASVATPIPNKPSRGIIVMRVTGTAKATDIAAASDTMARDLGNFYAVRPSAIAVTNLAKQADGICGAFRNNTIASGVLTATHIGGMHAHDTYSFTFNVNACFGPVLYTNTQTGDDRSKVVNDAVAAYVTDHPDNS